MNPRTDAIRVQMIQPIVPHYRVPFFEGIARRPDIVLSLSASARIRGLPPGEAVPGLSVDSGHDYREIFQGTFLWQRGLRLDPDLGPGAVLVIAGNPRFLSNYPLILEAKRRGVAIVWWGHAWSATSRPLARQVSKLLMSSADVLLLYTEAERQRLLATGSDARRIFALNNAIDERRIRSLVAQWPDERLTEFRRERSLAVPHVLLFCGRLRTTPSTELDVALRALERLNSRNPQYVLAVIGDGVDRERLETLATQLGVSAQVLWLGAIYSEELLAPWFLTARCFIYPGPVGLSLIQALAYGLPVITHDNPREHNPEIAALEHGVNGLTFRRGDPDDLVRRVQQICQHGSTRERMSRAASDTIVANYSMAAMIERFATAVKAAANAKHTPVNSTAVSIDPRRGV
jgi:glycosyltransferase involved in cell wall biosynthesis